MTSDDMKFAAYVVGALAVPVTAIAKVVGLAKDVEANKLAVNDRITAHETLCGERQRNLMAGQDQILQALRRLEARMDRE